MYGLVNKAIEDLVTKNHGEDAWSEITERAGLEDEGFLSMEPYDDALTYQLVGAASEVLEVPVDDLLTAFGEFWTQYTATEGYGELLDMSGTNLLDFLRNLDAMHSRVGFTFPDLKPPSFRLEEKSDSTFHLHYHSERPGLAPMVTGLLRGLSKRFEVELDVEHLVPEVSGEDHHIFAIRMTAIA